MTNKPELQTFKVELNPNQYGFAEQAAKVEQPKPKQDKKPKKAVDTPNKSAAALRSIDTPKDTDKK